MEWGIAKLISSIDQNLVLTQQKRNRLFILGPELIDSYATAW